jgi:hypothetical protein
MEAMMNYFKLLVTLPKHSDLGMTHLFQAVPAWEAEHGSGWSTTDLLHFAAQLEASAARRTGVEWGDIRARYQDMEHAHFLRQVVAFRTV